MVLIENSILTLIVDGHSYEVVYKPNYSHAEHEIRNCSITSFTFTGSKKILKITDSKTGSEVELDSVLGKKLATKLSLDLSLEAECALGQGLLSFLYDETNNHAKEFSPA